MREKLRWRVAFAISAALPLLATPAMFAAAPSNDTCAGAETIPGAGPFPYLSAIVDVRDATLNGDPPAPSCRTVNVTNAVWYRFTPTASRLYTLSVGTDTATTILDTVMSVYTNTGGCGGTFTPVFCNDDASGNSGLQSAIAANLTSNVTYYVVVWTTTLAPLFPGQTTLQLRVSQPTVPANDTCAGAEAIPASGPFPYLTSTVDTMLATTDGDPPAASCWNQAQRSVWFKFTPNATASYELSLCTNTATTIYETLLAVYAAASPCAGLTELTCNHTNLCSSLLRSTLTVPLTNGATYYIVAWEGVNDEPILGETLLQLRVAALFTPTASTLPATAVTLTNAAVNAFVVPNGQSTTAWFDWGTTTNYGNATAPQNLGSGTFKVLLSTPLSALTPGVTYNFRVHATNSAGAALGTNQAFLAAQSPSATTYAAYGLTSTGAVIEAIVTPNGATTSAYFQYGLTTSYGMTTAPVNLGAGIQATHLVSTLGGLTPGAQYHFRIVASNFLGTSFGSDRPFAWSPLSPHVTVISAANASFTFRFRGQPSQLYAVEASTNLVTWTNVGLADEVGGEFFEWAGPRVAPRQFYRVHVR